MEMTIAAVYRFDDKAIFVSDFRVTHKSNLHDTCIKFEVFEEIYMGLFLAGDIDSWKHLITKLRANIKEITFENILEDEYAFSSNIKSNVGGCRKEFLGKRIGAIGFILDLKHNKNKVFVIEGQMGRAVTISEVNNNQFLIIGSAEEVPNIHRNAQSILTEVNRARFNDNISNFASALRENINSSFKAAGTDSYEKLGVSPVMALAILQEAHFNINGEEFEKVQIGNEGIKRKRYMFTKNKESEVILKDEKQEIVLKTTFNMGNYKDDNEIFWEGFKSYDPSSQFGVNEYCYHLHQWYIPMSQTLYRILYKINFVGRKKLCDKIELAKNIKECEDLSENYEEQVDLYFIPTDDLKSNEIESIDASSILDNIKLRDFLGECIFNKLFTESVE
jgi:hypothetical protein